MSLYSNSREARENKTKNTNNEEAHLETRNVGNVVQKNNFSIHKNHHRHTCKAKKHKKNDIITNKNDAAIAEEKLIKTAG